MTIHIPETYHIAVRRMDLDQLKEAARRDHRQRFYLLASDKPETKQEWKDHRRRERAHWAAIEEVEHYRGYIAEHLAEYPESLDRLRGMISEENRDRYKIFKKRLDTAITKVYPELKDFKIRKSI